MPSQAVRTIHIPDLSSPRTVAIWSTLNMVGADSDEGQVLFPRPCRRSLCMFKRRGMLVGEVADAIW